MRNIYRSLLLLVPGATQKELARQVRYLKVENQILRGKLPERVAVTQQERSRLVRFGDKHAGWFTFVMADSQGRLLNREGSPGGIEVEESQGHLIRVGFGTHRMSGTPADQPVKLHPRCPTMAALLQKSSGQTDLATLQASFAEPSRGICVKSTIDMIVFDANSRTACLSRGPEYGVAWKTYRLG